MSNTTKCKFCGEEIRTDAIQCEHCSEYLLDEISVILTSAGTDKISVLKKIKEFTGLGFKESKNIVDSAPSIIIDKLKKSEALIIKKILEDAGAEVEFERIKDKIETEAVEKIKDPNEHERKHESMIFKIINTIGFVLSIITAIYVGNQYTFWWGLLAFIVTGFVVYLYFLPTNIAYDKDHNHITPICLLNLIPAFWPFILIWALCLKSNVTKGHKIVEPRGLTEKISESIDKFGTNIDNFDKKMDEKIEQLEEKQRKEKELNPEKAEKLEKFNHWIEIITATISLSLIVIGLYYASTLK